VEGHLSGFHPSKDFQPVTVPDGYDPRQNRVYHRRMGRLKIDPDLTLRPRKAIYPVPPVLKGANNEGVDAGIFKVNHALLYLSVVPRPEDQDLRCQHAPCGGGVRFLRRHPGLRHRGRCTLGEDVMAAKITFTKEETRRNRQYDDEAVQPLFLQGNHHRNACGWLI
jgi:hypothetical protein